MYCIELSTKWCHEKKNHVDKFRRARCTPNLASLYHFLTCSIFHSVFPLNLVQFSFITYMQTSKMYTQFSQLVQFSLLQHIEWCIPFKCSTILFYSIFYVKVELSSCWPNEQPAYTVQSLMVGQCQIFIDLGKLARWKPARIC